MLTLCILLEIDHFLIICLQKLVLHHGMESPLCHVNYRIHHSFDASSAQVCVDRNSLSRQSFDKYLHLLFRYLSLNLVSIT
jgi:hypothetical protein